MSTIDLSRQATDERKHYAGVRMQQGRVLTDDDFNEAATLDAEDMRRTRVHAIGAYGTPDLGFLPKNFTVTGGKLDFKLSNGSLYLGGLHLAMHSEDSFLLQKDWLNFDPATDAQMPPANGDKRNDLVWIETWQQPVTAVEDSELFEVALGGPDTSTRWRTLRRVRVAAGVTQSECAEAWAALVASPAFTPMGTLSAEMETITAARLTVSFSAPPAAGDLCAPPQPGGYLGAENQAIRVQMVSATHYTWGFDNASPLYRVQVSPSNGQLVKLKLMNQPKDSVHWPLKDQVVEILPWSAALPNRERIAELMGHLCKVQVSYNPDDQTLEIDTPLPATFGTQWEGRTDKAEFFDGSAEQKFMYLRVWNRGELASPAVIPIASKQLGNTGLEVTFSGGPPRPADYWVIAVRPAAPDKIVPWQLALPAGVPPIGVRRFRAPLALIQWSTTGGVTSATVLHDCRPPFLPLARLRGCCTVTVGDGSHSSGIFSSIQAAVDSLPPTGGTVCILPGRYEESVRLQAKRNVTLHGCGPQSRIAAPDTKGDGSTALMVKLSTDIVVEDLALEGGGSAVVEVRSSSAVRIARCLVQQRDKAELFTVYPAVFLEAQAAEIEGNIIEPLPGDLHRGLNRVAASLRGSIADAARGGIQLAGGCEQIRVADNVIVGGTGNGITLGSILRVESGKPGHHIPDIEVEDPCAPCDPTDSGPPTDDPDGRVRYESSGDLYDIQIDDNLILRHGASGISVVRYFGLSSQHGAGLVMVAVHGLTIEHNSIVQCLRRAVAQVPAPWQWIVGYGGVALAFATGLEIEGNLIAGNGRDWRTPVCGVFALMTDALRIEHNRIVDNGARGEHPLSSVQRGVRAGIHVWLALALETMRPKVPPQQPAPAPGGATIFAAAPPHARTRIGLTQSRIHANHVVQPLGRALLLLGAGAVQVTDNLLASRGAGRPATDRVADTVLLGNLGFSREWTRGLLGVLVYKLLLPKPGVGGAAGQWDAMLCQMARNAVLTPPIRSSIPTGKLHFNDNQVSFDMAEAPNGLDLSSTLLLSLDDVSANGNQFEHHADKRMVLTDLLALALTLRTSDNRLSETWGRAVWSALTLGLMNTTADNQSTHCLRAIGMQSAVHDNLVLAEAFCHDACSKDGWSSLVAAGKLAFPVFDR